MPSIFNLALTPMFAEDADSLLDERWITDAVIMSWFRWVKRHVHCDKETSVDVLSPSVAEVLRQTPQSELEQLDLRLNRRHVIFVPLAEDAELGGTHWTLLVMFNVFRCVVLPCDTDSRKSAS